MAEALLNEIGEGRFEAFSAGLEPSSVNPFAVEAMAELGIDISGAESKSLERFIDVDDIDLVVTLCSDADARCPIFPAGAAKEHWPFEDPAAFEGDHTAKLAKFREIREQISLKLQDFVSSLKEDK